MIFNQRVLSTREQARLIRREVIELVDKANEAKVEIKADSIEEIK